jgi:hypothetical protein
VTPTKQSPVTIIQKMPRAGWKLWSVMPPW